MRVRWVLIGALTACGLAVTSTSVGAGAAAEGSPSVGVISSAGDSLAGGSTESAAAGAGPARGTGVVSADQSASPADLVRAVGKGGGSATESVIAPDKRVRIAATTAYPARATVYMTFTQPGVGGTFSCTGFFVAPDTVATAGHCVHRGSGGSGGFMNQSSFRLYPGRNGGTIPYKCSNGAIVTAKRLWTNTAWAGGSGEQYDYGAVEINPCSNGTLMGNVVGWYGYINTQNATQTGLADYTQGYPGDKPTGTQWASNNCSTGAGTVQCTIQSTETRQLFYKNDTFGGQSGSPVYRKPSSCNPCAIAIHAYGLHGSSPHNTNNHGTRVENNVTSFLNTVRNS